MLRPMRSSVIRRNRGSGVVCQVVLLLRWWVSRLEATVTGRQNPKDGREEPESLYYPLTGPG